MDEKVLYKFSNKDLPTVVVMGLGFVGAAMTAAVSSAKDREGGPLFNVVGVDQATAEGSARVNAIKKGKFPFSTTDSSLETVIQTSVANGNLTATVDESVYANADVVIVDIHLDATLQDDQPKVDFEPFERAITTLGKQISQSTLVIIETTVPPGTCEHLVVPILRHEFENRGLDPEKICIAHSYERVMPGSEYLASINKFWRVYSGIDNYAASRCEQFLSSVIDVESFPLTRLDNMTSSEMAKVLENSYRAVNIALIDEWAVLAEAIGVDLFDVIHAIKIRPTHSNIMRPGLGVGGYCLTKDPYMALYSSSKLNSAKQSRFGLTKLAMEINASMPIRNADRFSCIFEKNVDGKRILMLGAAYRPEVGDTRFSAAEAFYRQLISNGAEVTVHDPYVEYWHEVNLALSKSLPLPKDYDAVIFCVGHKKYTDMDVGNWLGAARPLIYDCDYVLSKTTLTALSKLGVQVYSTGRGQH